MQPSQHHIPKSWCQLPLLLTGVLLVAVAASGCIASSYRYGLTPEGSSTPSTSPADSLEVSVGEPGPRLKRLEQFVQYPRRLLRERRGMAPETPESLAAQQQAAVEAATEYLHVNGLDNLYVDVRVYNPREQWERLRANHAIHPLFRYTAGSLGVVRYTLLPRTVFRSNHFDPFTQTLSLNSEDSPRAILEAAQVKEFRRERVLGLGAYATLQLVPFVPLAHQTRVASEALSYAEHHLDGEHLSDLYPLAYAQIGSTAVAESLSVMSLPAGTPIYTRPLMIGAGNLSGRSLGRRLSQPKNSGTAVQFPAERAPGAYSREEVGERDAPNLR